jgi:hypothetical protein
MAKIVLNYSSICIQHCNCIKSPSLGRLTAAIRNLSPVCYAICGVGYMGVLETQITMTEYGKLII